MPVLLVCCGLALFYEYKQSTQPWYDALIIQVQVKY